MISAMYVYYVFFCGFVFNTNLSLLRSSQIHLGLDGVSLLLRLCIPVESLTILTGFSTASGPSALCLGKMPSKQIALCLRTYLPCQYMLALIFINLPICKLVSKPSNQQQNNADCRRHNEIFHNLSGLTLNTLTLNTKLYNHSE